MLYLPLYLTDAESLEEQVEQLQKEVNQLQAENSTMRSRAADSETTRAGLLKISSMADISLEAQVSSTELQCIHAEMRKLKQSNASLTSSNQELKRENVIYQGEIDALNKSLRLEKNKRN